jgi:eukaryotic-like serine/threonine-protein kinase
LAQNEHARVKLTKPAIFGDEEAGSIMQNLLTGLSHVHDSGYIHRDMKPENIMLTPIKVDTSELKATLVDFGLSMKQKLSNQRVAEGEKVGTILYMAPE